MPIRLVDANRVLHVFNDEIAFERYGQSLNLAKFNAGNWRELLGRFYGQRDMCNAKVKYGHVLLESVVWVACERFHAVPLVGSPQEMFKQLKHDHGITLAWPTV